MVEIENTDVTFVVPAHNNLKYLEVMFAAFRRNCWGPKIIFYDDASDDGTWEWMQEQFEEYPEIIQNIHRTEERTGHTILYDRGIAQANTPIVGILHADMFLAPYFLENMLKHIERGKVVCATRIEPPLHPLGKEKIIRDFGQEVEDLDLWAFEEFAMDQKEVHANETTNGMFAPWIIYKEDFDKVGGHDDLFAPFPFEDSDIFQRWLQAGFELIQSWDSFVYHLTCRGHRWTEETGKDDEYYKEVVKKNTNNWLRKWGTWIDNDEYHHPILHLMYDLGVVVKNCSWQTLTQLEPLVGTLYVDCSFDKYIEEEQPNTKFDLSQRIKSIEEYNENIHEVDIHIDEKEVGNKRDFMINAQRSIEYMRDSLDLGEWYGYKHFKLRINR